MSHTERTAAATLAGLLALGLSACAPGGQAAETNGADLLPSSECAVEDGALRVYLNPWGSTLSDRFTADTGVTTEIADLGGGEILARIAAEANNPQWDVVVLDGHGSLESLREQGALLSGHPLENLGNLDEDGAALAPEDGSWVPISRHAAAVIAYNTDRIDPDEAPGRWSDLADPAYAPIGMADPAVAAPAYPIVSWFFQDLGRDEAEDYFGTLIDNGLNTYEKNGPVGQALASGEVPVAALQEQNVYGLIDSGEPVDFVWPEEGAPGVVRAAAISERTPRPCAAQKLVDWLLTPEAMGHLMAEGGDDGIISPLVSGTDTSSLPETRPEDGELLVTDAVFAAENEADVKNWFAERSVQGR
ncbi:ABC transporter substrate-binding protein [Nocardiopsis lambiniae]|uniref:Extracellular solute-binding protein n=1 Tax=Nocardiopsis lambiniae TaxID=3075539 RepID=A0ABU2M4K2_9ACTN|nr:extracellular solute-binding protein [Nocardiopsis sp. DSM 44743]MDT0327550.1 extracellular solute-binding protein [Nocardiopsis sp. DSM 44743]